MAEYDLGTARGKIEIDSSQVEQGVGQAQAKVSDFDRSQQVAAQNLVRSGTLMVGAAATIAGGFAVAVNASADFETSMQQIVGLVGVSQEQVDAWKGDLLNMAGALGKSPKELADALFFITSAGLQGKDAMDALDISARASAAGLGETKVVADAVTSAMNAYGKENVSAAQAADILTATVKEGKTEASALAPVLGRILPVAAEMGVKFNDVGAAIASMTREGLNADQASTRVSAILRALIKPGQDAQDALKGVGLSMDDVRASIQEKGLFNTLMMLKDAVHGNQQELARIFPDSEAFGGVLSITGKNADANRQIFDEMANSTGSLDKAFQSASQTANFKFQQAMQSLQAVLIQVGAILAPAAADFAQFISGILQWIGQLDPGILNIIVTIGKFVAVLLGTVGAFMIVIGWIKKLQFAFAAAQSFLMANPFTAVILALVALGVAFYAAYQNIQPFHEWVDRTVQTLKNDLMPIIEGVRQAISDFVEGFTKGTDELGSAQSQWAQWGATAYEIWLRIQDLASAVNDFVNTLGGWQNVLMGVGIALALVLAPIPTLVAGIIYAYENFDAFRTVVDAVVTALIDAYHWFNDNIYPVIFAFGELVAAVAQRVIEAWNTMWPFISVALGLIQAGIENFVSTVMILWDNFGSDILSAITLVFDNIRGVVEAALQIIQGIIDTVTALIKGDWSGVWTGIQEIFQGVWDFMRQYVETIIGGIQLTIQTTIDAIKAAWQIAWQTVHDVFHGLWQAVHDFAVAMIDAIKDKIKGTVDSIVDLWKTAWDTVKGYVEDVWKAIKGAVEDAIDWVHDKIDLTVGSIKDIWNSAWDAVSSKAHDVWETIKSDISGAIGTILGWIADFPGNVAAGASAMFSPIVDAAHSAANGIIGFFNRMIDFINGFGIHVHIHDPIPGLPNIDFDWDPNIPHIPTLDIGGLVRNPTLAALAMNSVPEIVSPVPMLEAMFQKYSQPTTIDLTFSFTGVSKEDIPAIKSAVTGDDVLDVLISAAKAGRRD